MALRICLLQVVAFGHSKAISVMEGARMEGENSKAIPPVDSANFDSNVHNPESKSKNRADDHVLVRDGLCQLLEAQEDLECVARAKNAPNLSRNTPIWLKRLELPSRPILAK